MNRFYLALLAMVIVLGALAGLMFVHHQTKQALQLEQQHNQQLTGQLEGRDALLSRYRLQSLKNAELTISQQQTITSINNQLQNTGLQMRKLEQDNEAIRQWADTRLPEPVMRLHQRPALSGATGYRKWLSSRDTMPTTSQRPNG
jgi:LysB family phage lysis regulatory protein